MIRSFVNFAPWGSFIMTSQNPSLSNVLNKKVKKKITKTEKSITKFNLSFGWMKPNCQILFTIIIM